MLTLIKGPASSSRDEVLLTRIEQAADNGRKVLVIIPDQYSFECDKKLYDRLGAKRFNRIGTVGFNRLAKELVKSTGGSDADNANEQVKLIIMYKAVLRLKKETGVRYYKKALDKGSFISESLSLIREMTRAGITPGDLRFACEKAAGTLAAKLSDLSALYEFYLEELSAAGFKDSMTVISEAVSRAEDTEYFKGTDVFIDSFTSFSYDELRMLECIVSQADNVDVSLILSERGDHDELFYPFAPTVKTKQRLKEIAAGRGVKVNEIECEETGGAAPDLLRLNNALCGKPVKETGASDGSSVRIVSANDLYDETEYVSAEIIELTRQQGCKLNDIAVCARDLGAAAPVIGSIFERYGIPCFIDLSQKAEESVIAIYLKNILDCVVTEKYRTDAIMRYIKSPLCKLFDYDIADIEDYCYVWNVKGDMWKQEFCAHDETNKVSARLEETRKQIIEPLERFKAACTDASCSQICKAFFALLDEIDISSQVYSVVKRGSGDADETETELARAFKQLWSGIIGAVSAMNDTIGDEKMTIRQFSELFRIMISQQTVSQPPQKLECVRCVSAERSRLDNVRVLFVLDVNDGIFPADAQSGGLFSEREKQQLAALKLELESTAAAYVENEKLVLYRTLVLPSERLYVCYVNIGGDNKPAVPSKAVRFIEDTLPEAEHISVPELPIEFFCTSHRSGYYKYLEYSKHKLAAIIAADDENEDKKRSDRQKKAFADKIASLEAALSEDEKQKAKIAALRTYKEQSSHSITPKLAKELFVKDKLELSATKIDTYYKCPYMYFAKYGLKLKAPQKVDMSMLYKGNYLHRCLEGLMTKEADGKRSYNDSFLYFTKDQLKEKIHSEFLKYRSEEIGGDYGKTDAYFAMLEHYEKEVLENILIIQTELSDCLFVPQFFEYKLDKNDDESILEITLAQGVTVSIRGSIDRADVFTAPDGKKYMRIIDYKTGSTEFKLEQLYHGLNLQMFIYMLAMTEGLGGFEASAVQYVHIKPPAANRAPDSPDDEEEIFAAKADTYEPQGMIIEDRAVFDALNLKYDFKLVPFKLNNDGAVSKSSKNVVTEEIFKAAEKFAKQKIISCAEKLLAGNVQAAPVFIKSGSNLQKPCTYCDYYGMCGRTATSEAETVLTTDDALMRDVLQKIAGEGESNENA